MLDSQQLTFAARRNNMQQRRCQRCRRASTPWANASGASQDPARRDTERQIELLDGGNREQGPACVQAGLIRKPELMALQRAKANLNGEIGRLMGEIGDAKERIARTEEQINGVRNTAVKTAMEQLHEIRGELSDVRERMRERKGILDRVQIAAPVAASSSSCAIIPRAASSRPARASWNLLPLEGRADDRGARAAAGHRPREASGSTRPCG